MIKEVLIIYTQSILAIVPMIYTSIGTSLSDPMYTLLNVILLPILILFFNTTYINTTYVNTHSTTYVSTSF